MLKSEDFIRLGSNLIDNNGENNIKIAEVLTHSQNVSVKIYDSLLKLFVLDELTGKNLDDYGARFNVPRQNLDDNDYRALIKAMSIIKFKGNTYNSITEALALYLRVSESAITLSEIQPDDTDYPRFTLIKHIIVKDTIDINKLLSFIYAIKAGGVIIACYKYRFQVTRPVYDTVTYSSMGSLHAPPLLNESYMIDCNGVITEETTGRELNYEYDLHNYDLNEVTDSINEH